MKLFVGLTNDRWFHFLSELRPDEVNFWRPRSVSQFHVLQPGDLFLFKLHAPHHFIVGGGFFVKHLVFPLSYAWDSFNEKNGASNIQEFYEMILAVRRDRALNPPIGCTILAEPFFWERRLWILSPEDFGRNIVQGKSYTVESPTGKRLWEEVMSRLQGRLWSSEDARKGEWDTPRYSREFLTRARLGQGTFKVLVTESYQRRCVVSGERALPVLEAAHIKPFAENGPNRVDNGLLLRADIHNLFDSGYLTITPAYRIEVSRRIREEFENGKEYFKFHGQNLTVLPSRSEEHPRREFLEYHNSKFLG